VLDAGICGHDWVIESGADVVEVRDRMVLGCFGCLCWRTGVKLSAPCVLCPIHTHKCNTMPPPPPPHKTTKVCELPYSKATSNPARWVLAVREDSPVQCVEDLEGTIVASELMNTTRK
jgi:ATP phosphoribosyltransferase